MNKPSQNDYLLPYVSKNTIFFFDAVSKRDALIKLIGYSVRNSPIALLRNDIEWLLFEREDIMSTGIGRNFAVPHARVAGLERPHVYISVLDNPVDFKSIDHQPVKVIFLILTPHNALREEYLHLLASIVLRIRDTKIRQLMLKAKDPDQFFSVLAGE